MNTFSQSRLPVASRDMTKPESPVGLRTQMLLVAGGILAALGAASCCVVPFALFVVGISGAWIGNLTALQPYQPVFAAAAVAAIGYGFYLVYRRPRTACDDGTYCASPRSIQLTKVGLWIATGLVVIALGFPKVAPLFL
jgi:mercuric ion transport protein